MKTSRNRFLKSMGLGIAGLTLVPQLGNARQSTVEGQKLDAELVKEFVANCHGNFARVKELYQKQPLLIFSSNDWNNGDFENGIEAAGHKGQKEIAYFLLERGARINFFTLCMLGKTEVVSVLLKQFPNLVNAKGPHGFTPLHHAIQGGNDSKEIKELLESLGATELQLKL